MVERGAEHNTKTKTIPAKKFSVQDNCKCINAKKPKPSCSSKIGTERQKEIFVAYYEGMNWTQKTLFIRSCVVRNPVKSKKSCQFPLVALKNRQFNFTYSLIDSNGLKQQVCRDFFMKCLKVSADRVRRALSSAVHNQPGTEKRGKHIPRNKTSDADKQGVRDFIDRFPKYESHYGRSCSQRKYLHHNLSLKKLYDKYKEEHEFKNLKFVSRNIFRQIFNHDFNLSFKRRHTDTCRTCDEINTNLQSSLITVANKKRLTNRLMAHNHLVKKTNAQFKLDIKEAEKSKDEIAILTFDLQKTLETPSLTASDAFYKRTLWTYNLCIYDEVYRQGFMYVWSENVASRGGQEIGSCLIKHFKSHLPENTKIVKCYSDSCGGQNRNIKVALHLKKYLHELTPDSQLQTIEQKYFVPGHSYNSCDRCFGIIEKKKKKSADLYTPNDWINLIKDAKISKPLFNVTVMEGHDFISTTELEKVITNRKKNTNGDKVNWFHIRTLSYHRDEPFLVYVVSIDGKQQSLNIKKKGFDENSFTTCNVPKLYPDGKSISIKKYNDLMQLLKYVPQEKHSFFIQLKTDESEDYGFASDISED